MYEPGKCESKADSAETPVSVEPNDVGVTGNENDCAQIPVQVYFPMTPVAVSNLLPKKVINNSYFSELEVRLRPSSWPH